MLDPRVAILEELRTADRLVASATSTLDYATRQQTLDLIGLPNTEGAFDGQTQRDNASALATLLEAEHTLKRVAESLGHAPPPSVVSPRHWSLTTDLIGGVFDLIPLMQLAGNSEDARRLHARVREMFNALRASDPALAPQVEPLTDWTDGPGELATAYQFNRPAVILMGLLVAGLLVGVVAYYVLMFV